MANDASITFRLPAGVHRAFGAAYGDGVSRRLRQLVERDLRERSRKRKPSRDCAPVPVSAPLDPVVEEIAAAEEPRLRGLTAAHETVILRSWPRSPPPSRHPSRKPSEMRRTGPTCANI